MLFGDKFGSTSHGKPILSHLDEAGVRSRLHREAQVLRVRVHGRQSVALLEILE